MKGFRSAAATLIFLILLVCIYYVHVSYFKVNVVFYSAITDVIIAATITGFVVFLVKFFAPLCCFEKMLLIVVWFLIGYSVAISGPTVLDRSLSFYILEKLQQRGGAIRQDAFEWIFVNEYMVEHHLVDVRLTEQLESGTIKIKDGCVKLTEKGDNLASFGHYFRKHWLPKKRLLMGEYTDDLTDPFRLSIEDFDYTCK